MFQDRILAHTITPDEALACVEETIGGRYFVAEPVEGLGFSNQVFKVIGAETTVAMRSNKVGHLGSFRKEAWALGELQTAGVLVPNVLGVGQKDERFSFSLTEWVPESRRIGDAHEQEHAWEVLGAYARVMNSIRTTGYGAAMISPGCFEKNWPTHIEETLNILEDERVIRSGVFNQSEVRSLSGYLSENSQTDSAPGLCQWDICPDNAVKQGDNIFLLDLEQVDSVPVPYAQLGYVIKNRGLKSAYTKAFLRGYQIDRENYQNLKFDIHRFVMLAAVSSVGWAINRKPSELEAKLRALREFVVEARGEGIIR